MRENRLEREPWPSISESAKSVKQMLEPNVKLRLTAKQVLGHPIGSKMQRRLQMFLSGMVVKSSDIHLIYNKNLLSTNFNINASYDEFVAMMKTGTDLIKASRLYSIGRFNSLSIKLMKDGSINSGRKNIKLFIHSRI